MRRAATGVLLAALLAVPAGCGGGDEPSTPPQGGSEGRIEQLSAGRGRTGALVFRRADLRGKRLPVVLFVHGWGGIAPEIYRGWIDHLARRGNAVIYPRYQDSVITPPGTALGNLILGVRAALALPGAPVDPSSLVAVGHSAGGVLAADYAAAASAARLPTPRAIFAAYPGRAFGPDTPPSIPEIPGAAIPATTRIVALAGERDEVVGTRWARRLIANAPAVPRAQRQYRLVTDDAVDDHQAPAGIGAAARTTFWRPFDELTALARRR